MLTFLRKGATSWVAQLFILLLSMSFAFFGIESVFKFAREKPVAVVGSARIEPQAFTAEFRREIDRMRRSFGNSFDAAQAHQFGMDRQVLDRMITLSLFDQRANEIGVVVGDQAVATRIQSEPALKGPAGFDRMQFESILRNMGISEGMFIELMRGDIKRAQLIDVFQAQPPAPTALAEPLFRRQREERIAKFFVVTNAALGAIAAPTEAQIKDYYTANEARFSAPEMRKLTYVNLTAKDLVKSVQVPEDDVKAAYERRKEEFVTPLKREIDQVIISDKDKAAKAAAKIASGADFAAVAQEFGGIKPNELSLGLITANDLPLEVAGPAFEAPIGKVIGPIESAFGTTFLRATKEIPGAVKSFDEARKELTDSLALETATDRLYDLSRKIEDRRAGGETLAAIATDLDLTLSELPLVDAQGNEANGVPAKGLPAEPQVLAEGFKLEAGLETDLIEVASGHYLLVRADQVVPSAVKPLETVKTQVIAAWTTDERAAKLKALAADLLAKAKAAGDLTKTAAEIKASVTVSKPLQRGKFSEELGTEVPSALFDVAPLEFVMGPAPAGAGIVIARLERILPVDLVSEAANLKSAKDDLGKAMANDLLDQYQAMLKSKYEVTINEKVLASTVGVRTP